MTHKTILTVSICCLLILCQFAHANKKDGDKKDTEKKKFLPKDPLYITEFDIDKLYDQWEETDDEKLPNDELEPHKRKRPIIRNEDELFNDPEKAMRAAKVGQTVMGFVTVDNNPTKEETERLTQRWQVGLGNAHMKCERFVIGDDRAIFVFKEGSLAFEAMDYLIEQPELLSYSIDNRNWYGKAHLARSQEECPYDPKNPTGPISKCEPKPASEAALK